MKKLALSLLVSAAMPVAALAQDTPNETESDGETVHIDRIVVSATGVRDISITAGQSVVEGEDLLRNQAGQVGDILDSLPGVATTGFSPGASRPILRGLDAGRVRVLTNGLGNIDAAETSADHGVAIDPLTARRVEVIRGPASLLYGSSAIGGVVNVIDSRLPTALPEGGYDVSALASADTAYDLREFGAAVDLGLGEGFVLHANGSYRETDDFEIPGFQLTDDLRADLLADAAEEEEEGNLDEAEELREQANVEGFVPNSGTETYSFGVGAGYVGDGIRFAASASYYDTLYGIPSGPGGHHHHEDGHDDDDHDDDDHDDDHGDEEEGEENVSIDLEQARFDFEAGVAVGGFFDEAILRLGHSVYTHTELEGEETGTVFDVRGTEGRFELTQAPTANWRGVIGAQFYLRDFEAIGAEAFVAPNETEQYGLFTLQELFFGNIELELGGRYETVNQSSDVLGIERDFDIFSGAVGFAYNTQSGFTVGINGTRTERAPSGEELFANGPHLATQQFEIGDPDLGVESVWGVEGYASATLGPVQARAAVYYNTFDNFIYLSETGEEEDELPVFEFLQDDADFIGFEVEASAELFQVASGSVIADVGAGYVEAELSDGSPLPRIPPLELLGALEWQSSLFDLRGEVEYYDDQTRVAEFEEPTDGFTHVNFSASIHPFRDDRFVLLLQADNIFDVEGRRHTSFTKEYVPLAGRNFRVTARTRF
ncbi:TonB-dependent receptor [Aurantiacibacter poecillastricola]|uniref:TonB-dependent receptor n=1 Tax=Aurantiacibacter poecillastricola TaxID=3064385 RepID=UPI0027401437|nr:TonB-dependent receptor [Aurantiacibacter sp. 219JJ12-13]MDP5260182.1 TonB-dependent receptor [Aurantiacibacter sp. 219JJ12-13]